MKNFVKKLWSINVFAWKLSGATACILIGAKGINDVWKSINR